MRALLLIAFAGCYSPNAYAPCHTQCATDDGCTPGLVCGGNGYCREPSGGDCSPTLDAAIDARRIDAPPGSICFGTGFIDDYCFLPGDIPANDLVLPNRFNTDDICSDVIDQPQNGAPDICVMTGKTFRPVSPIRVVGMRPLAIITTDGITITSSIDVSSTSAEAGPGAASGLLLCGAAASGQPGVGASDGGGGGPGGGLTAAGGNGGEGAGVRAGGMGNPAKNVTFVRGGCSGGHGGNAQSNAGGAPGAGGGAIYLLTKGTLAISGIINASGAGGQAPGHRAGGGGGGSGGFIALDARVFDIAPTARIFASGGAGASGGGATSDGVAGGLAGPGGDPTTTNGADGGGSGGAGSSTSKGVEGGPAGTIGGGGGGGGGAGYVGFAGPYDTNLTTTVVRPRALTMP